MSKIQILDLNLADNNDSLITELKQLNWKEVANVKGGLGVGCRAACMKGDCSLSL
ncbi:hypothetical protein [Merismopedia glauca]|uniref:hypothetical protein n=1 Tax=Merismopedia glauca TaxID=292586 RepID=UPI0015E75F59|nr:hypothetical protein [Merismopedia glauca]